MQVGGFLIQWVDCEGIAIFISLANTENLLFLIKFFVKFQRKFWAATQQSGCRMTATWCFTVFSTIQMSSSKNSHGTVQLQRTEIWICTRKLDRSGKHLLIYTAHAIACCTKNFFLRGSKFKILLGPATAELSQWNAEELLWILSLIHFFVFPRRYPKPGTIYNPTIILRVADLADPKSIRTRDLTPPPILHHR